MELDQFCDIEIDGKIEVGKQYDLDITLPTDSRGVIYGTVKDCFGNLIENAVVKLIQISKEDRKPISHTFTNQNGEFVFGPLCLNRSYAVEIWASEIQHIKICKTCFQKFECLKPIKICDEEKE